MHTDSNPDFHDFNVITPMDISAMFFKIDWFAPLKR